MKRLTLAALGVLATATAPLAASAGAKFDNYNRPIHDHRGNIVTTKSGDCVVHLRWEGGKAGECIDVTGKHVSKLAGEATVYFAFNSSKLSVDAQKELDKLVAGLKGKKVNDASVVGYADKIGNVDYNRRLSEKRALRVAKYLQSKGLVSASVAEIKAVGEADANVKCPAKASAGSIKCNAPDRRVEVKVTAK